MPLPVMVVARSISVQLTGLTAPSDASGRPVIVGAVAQVIVDSCQVLVTG